MKGIVGVPTTIQYVRKHKNPYYKSKEWKQIKHAIDNQQKIGGNELKQLERQNKSIEFNKKRKNKWKQSLKV